MANIKTYTVILAALLSIGLFSCKKNGKRIETEKIITEWIGKEIRFPDNFQCNVLGKDTASALCSGLLDAEYKILLYVDSLGCTNCKLRLLEWKQLMAEIDSLNTNHRLDFLFFFHPKDKKELLFLFKRDKMNYPVFIDSDNAIDSLNNFPEQMEYQCFLLDRDNRVIMIGNPVLNPRIREVYKKQVFGEYKKPEELITVIETDKTVYDFGKIRMNTKSGAVFSIKNTGVAPLVINRVSTSCGCTAVDWDKEPIESGKSSEIKIEMHPEEEGAFNKTIHVYCNVKESPVKLTITGTVTK
jgi:hypothetical protein